MELLLELVVLVLLALLALPHSQTAAPCLHNYTQMAHLT
jgi:hypothetical protein